MVTKNWVNTSGGSFTAPMNWNQDPMHGEVGPPGTNDSAHFAVGGTYTVTGGGTVKSISITDNVTLSGSYTVAQGIGSTGGKTLTLTGGTFATTKSVGGNISAGNLVLDGATVTGGGVGDGTAGIGYTSTGSTLNLGDYLIGSGHVAISGGSSVSTFFQMSGTGTISGTNIDAVVDGSGGSGTARIDGTFGISQTNVDAAALDLIGKINWAGGSIDVDLLHIGKTSNGDQVNLSGVHVQTAKFEDATGSFDPSTIVLNTDSSWEAASDFISSGKYVMKHSTLTTGNFSVNPNRGAGAEVSVSSGAHLTSKGHFNAASLAVTDGGVVAVAGGFGVSGETTVADGKLSIGKDVTGFGKITVGGNGFVHFGGADASAPVDFAKGNHKTLSLGGPDLAAPITGFGQGDALLIDGLGKKAKFTASHNGSATDLTFHGKHDGTVHLAGSFSKGDFTFNAHEGSLTLDKPFTGNGKGNKLVGSAGDDTLRGKGGADKLTGNEGADDLDGGKDKAKDVFVFKTDDDSGKGAKTADHIFNFKSGTDKIDLSDLDVKWADITLHDKGPNVKVLIDTHGSNKPDMLIDVMHVKHLDQGDFIL